MPRSPSRDRSDRYAGHRRYFRGGDAAGRGKVLLACVGLVVAVGWATADALWWEPMQSAHTHGELAGPHASFAHDCEQCHRPFDGTRLSPFEARERWHDLTCEKCHAGPPHHTFNNSADQQADARCGDCHHDHRGQTNSLTRIADTHCTGCHQDLSHHPAKPTYPGESPIHSPVTSFANDHPAFRGLTAPPEARALKFSHALHMTPGLVYQKGATNALSPKRMAELKLDDAANRFTNLEDGLVRLNCGDCHQLDAGAGEAGYDALKALLNTNGEPVSSVLPVRAGGAHFLPVNFEAHCRACHPVKAPPEVVGKMVVPGIEGFPLPHRRSWADMPEVVKGEFLKHLLEEDHPALRSATSPASAGSVEAEAKALRETAAAVSVKAMAHLGTEQGCVKCHDLTDGEIAPLPDRTVWLRSARFDHTAHKAVSCKDCHPGPYAAVPPGGRVNEREAVSANILGRESCVKCHSPAGGVRHGCTDCHSYHNGDHPLQGRGATARMPHPFADALRK